MPIVTTSKDKKPQFGLEELIQRKAEIKQELEAQQHHIQLSTKKLFSPISLAGFVLSLVDKKMNVVDGVKYGYQLFQNIRSFFKKRKE